MRRFAGFFETSAREASHKVRTQLRARYRGVDLTCLQGIEAAATMLVGEIIQNDTAQSKEPSKDVVNLTPGSSAANKSGCC